MRKNQATLTAAEKTAFVDALLELKRQGVYDRFVRTHDEFVMSDSDFGPRVAHRSPSFLPWHRYFLIEFERELQRVAPSVFLPYWDWTDDRSPEASLWGEDFLGGDGRAEDGQVTNGAFAGDRGAWNITDRVDTWTSLRRSMGARGRTLPTRREVDSVLALATYDQRPWNSRSQGFRNRLEGWVGANLHNRVHTWVGGNMVSGTSPNDPVFWLHHCFIDKLWADWQRLHPESTYLPLRPTADVVSLHDRMRPWNTVRPVDMLDHTSYYSYDTDPDTGTSPDTDTDPDTGTDEDG
ncbi:tyrosinase family protein [Streptomyces sp. NPDC058486]|uniref:tyrosinase MelC2 n=1 Tax=unclassified Streptomyces TaxID=2593676 RepID=UPI003654C8FC